MESPNKRLKHSPPTELAAQDEFVSLDVDDGEESKFGYGTETSFPQNAPKAPRAQYQRDARFDRRNAQDRPKSKHVLPGHEPWVLVKTKLGRRFVHNTQTNESLWRVPEDVWQAVKEFDAWETAQREKEANAQWAEEELKKMREGSKAEEGDRKSDAEEGRSRRRRSESLQREDEEAMMAELAAEAERAEERDVKQALKTVEPVAGEFGYESEGSYEYIEVTDSEGEEGDAREDRPGPSATNAEAQPPHPEEDEAPVEFGEDDIAYQLAAMGASYGLDPGEYGSGPRHDGDYEEGAESCEEGALGLALTDEDAANLFRDLLDDYRISPFTPWEKLITDESEASILRDDRYTILPNMKARKDVWAQWAKDKAAQLKEERAQMEKKDPRIPYLAFLAERATARLYWPEFKRKFKREPALSERGLAERDKERLYREHVNRLKLPEGTRRADLVALLKGVPLRELNSETRVDALPQQVLAHLHYISLPSTTRDGVAAQWIRGLPAAPEEGDVVEEEQRVEEGKRRAEKRRREEALAGRQRKVDEERRKAEKEEMFARRDLREEEREVQRAMAVGRRGLKAQLAGEGDAESAE